MIANLRRDGVLPDADLIFLSHIYKTGKEGIPYKKVGGIRAKKALVREGANT